MTQEQATGRETPVIVGTAGHVDHGKSSLVTALTGTDPDRLPQEKARGITIDLGFAELALPGGRTVGVVDVPGHEHYVRAMAAGAAGVDVALLVVAADDGVMPQTREHLRILEAFGAARMVVALTKRDLVDDELLELVQMDVEEFLAGTRFAGAPVVPVSSRTRAGLDELLAALDEAVEGFLASGAAAARAQRPARLAVDRAFNVAGVGAVVTGTLRSGSLRPGDAVEVLPAGVRARVRGVQTHGRDVAQACAGQRTAVNLSGVSLDQVPRGSTVCAPGSLRPCDRFDARLHWLGRDGAPAPLASGDRVHVCAGTAQALGRVLLFDGQEQLACGQDALVQIRLETPLVMAAHDRFVAMAYSPVALAGGGEVLWREPPRRSAPTAAERALLQAVEAGDEHAAVRAELGRERFAADAAQVAGVLDLSEARAAELLDELAAAGEAARLPVESGTAHFMDPGLLDELVGRVAQALGEAGRAHPDNPGMPLQALRDAVAARMDPVAFAAVVAVAQQRGLVGRFGAVYLAAQDVERVQREAFELQERVEKALGERGLATPFVDELAGELGMPEPLLRRGLTMLAEAGRAVAVDRNYVLGSAAIEQARGTVAEAIRAAGGAAATSDLREALGMTRKYVLPLLEYLDRVGFTAYDAAAQTRSLAKG